jgi:hypothetical protein
MLPESGFSSTSEAFLIAQILITICALFLLGISIKAYRNTRLRKLIYVAIAFVLFAIQHILNYVDQVVVHFMPDDIRYLLFSLMTLAIMGMFFLTILKK